MLQLRELSLKGCDNLTWLSIRLIGGVPCHTFLSALPLLALPPCYNNTA